MTSTLRTTFRQALNTHDEALLDHVFDACTHHLATLLESKEFTTIRVFTQAIEDECRDYLISAKAQQSMSLRLLKHVTLHRDHVFKIRNDMVAKAFAGKNSQAENCQSTLYLMVEFTQQKRPYCCDEIYTPEVLDGHLAFGDQSLKQAFLALLTSYFEMKAAPPPFWLDLARKHQAGLAETLNFDDYRVGADLALAAHHFGMNEFCAAILPRIITAPKLVDYGHLLKIESLGERFGGLRKKQMFVEAERIVLGPDLSKTVKFEDRQRARTLIIAIQVYDFYKSDDYQLTTGEPRNKDMRSWLADSASYIWTQDKETRGDELLALLNRDFDELSLAKGVEDFFDEDLYRHLEVTRADALESDLGL